MPEKDAPATAEQPTASTAARTETPSAAEAKNYAEILRRAEAAESRLKELDSEKSRSEYETLKSRAAAAENELKNLRTEKAFSDAAVKAKAKNAAKLFSLVKDKIEYDEHGNPKDLSKVIETAKKDYPEEFGAAGSSVDAGAKGSPAASAGSAVDAFIRGALR